MSCEYESLNIIRGDSFGCQCHFDNEDDEPIDLTNVEIEASLETLSHSWQQPLIITKADQIAHRGDFLMSADSTTGWMIGDLQIKLTRIKGTARLSVLIPITVQRG